MGCQRDIAAKIVSRGGDYVLQVKGNQPTLQEAIEASFAESDNVDKKSATKRKARQRTTKEKSRGRQETRQKIGASYGGSLPPCSSRILRSRVGSKSEKKPHGTPISSKPSCFS